MFSQVYSKYEGMKNVMKRKELNFWCKIAVGILTKNYSLDYYLERDTKTLDCDKSFSAKKIYNGIIITLQGKFLVLPKCVYLI